MVTTRIAAPRAMSETPKPLFWLLVACIALPLRIDLAVGPFTTISTLDAAVIIATAYVVVRFLSIYPIRLGPTILAASVVTPALIALLSVGWALDITSSVASSIRYIYCVIAYFVALQFGRALSQAELARVLAIILVSWWVGSIAMYLGVPGFSYFFAQADNRAPEEVVDTLASIYTRFGHPYLGQSNDYGPLLALLAFILLGHARASVSRVFLIISAIGFVSAALTVSRGLLAGLVIAASAYALVEGVRLRAVVITVATVTVALGATLFALSETSIEVEGRELDMAQIVQSRLSEENVQSRLERYRETLEHIFERPFVGYGAGYYPKDAQAAISGAAHNSLLEQWTYFGVVLGSVTFACYITILVGILQLRSEESLRSFASALACGWICLVVASLGETFFEATVPREIVYLVLGLCVGTASANMEWTSVSATKAIQ